MECLICGKNFVNLGVHTKRKHDLTADEYRLEFGMMKTTPLVDKGLSDHISAMAKITFSSRGKIEQEEIRERCRDNSAKHSCTPGAMSEAGKIALAERNSQRNKLYLSSRVSEVKKIISSENSALAARKALGMGRGAILGMVKAGLLTYDLDAVESARLAKVARTVTDRRALQIEQVLSLYNSKLTLSEICKSVGIGSTTYKKWRSDGLIANRKTFICPPTN